jgi:hypothetical protein
MADYPKLLLAGALILVAAESASAQQGRAAGDKDSMLAFVSERDGNSEIYVMDADGSFDFVYDVYVMNADGSNITPLFAGPFSPGTARFSTSSLPGRLMAGRWRSWSAATRGIFATRAVPSPSRTTMD